MTQSFQITSFPFDSFIYSKNPRKLNAIGKPMSARESLWEWWKCQREKLPAPQLLSTPLSLRYRRMGQRADWKATEGKEGFLSRTSAIPISSLSHSWVFILVEATGNLLWHYLFQKTDCAIRRKVGHGVIVSCFGQQNMIYKFFINI